MKETKVVAHTIVGNYGNDVEILTPTLHPPPLYLRTLLENKVITDVISYNEVTLR